jgi:hypothetical protein
MAMAAEKTPMMTLLIRECCGAERLIVYMTLSLLVPAGPFGPTEFPWRCRLNK